MYQERGSRMRDKNKHDKWGSSVQPDEEREEAEGEANIKFHDAVLELIEEFGWSKEDLINIIKGLA
jgi:hypothetical protein